MTIIERESLSVPHDPMLDEFIKENLILHQALLKPCQVSYKRLFSMAKTKQTITSMFAYLFAGGFSHNLTLILRS